MGRERLGCALHPGGCALDPRVTPGKKGHSSFVFVRGCLHFVVSYRTNVPKKKRGTHLFIPCILAFFSPFISYQKICLPFLEMYHLYNIL